MTIKIMIGCDRRMVAEGIWQMTQGMEGVELIASLAAGNEILQKLKEASCQVLLLDFQLPGVLETARLVRARHPQVKVILLLQDELTRFKQILQTGAIGYLQQTDGKEELAEALRTVNADKPYVNEMHIFEPSVQGKLGRNGHAPDDRTASDKATPGNDHLKLLSKRETEVLRMVGQELSSAEIAKKLFISVQTVETHRRNIMKKLGARNLIGLLKYALREGLLE